MFNMLSECEDDLCIFVCGTCKRYFTQLTAFAQHKKEKLCKKTVGLPGRLFANNFLTSTQTLKRNYEEIDPEYADVSLDSQEYQDFTDGQIRNDEENDYEISPKRKYPRKQDKAKIKRTVRDMDSEPPQDVDKNQDESNLVPCDSGATSLATMANSGHANLLGAPTQEPTYCRHLVYVCKACHKEFSNNLSKPYRCCDCRRGFQTERELRVHVTRAKHDNLCDVCGKIFPDKYKLRKHTLSHVTEKNFPCDHPGCGKAFKSSEDVRTHMKYVHAIDKPYKCLQCARAFARPDKYKQHLLTHRHQDINDEQEALADGMLETRATNAASVSSELDRIKSEEGRRTIENFHDTHGPIFPPSVEPQNNVELPDMHQTAVAESITKTSISESGRRPPGSDDDEQSTPLSPEDAAAVKDGVESTGRPEAVTTTYECQVCGLRFDDVDKLDAHVQMHDETTGREQCERCYNTFRGADELLSHEERRPDHVLRCEQCSAKFLSVCDLYVHGREVHGASAERNPAERNSSGGAWRATRATKGEKHVCGECGKGFTRADKLRRHAVIHSPDRPCIPCPCRDSHGCLLTFYRKDSVKRHALTHSLERPFKCGMCDKSFSRRDYLTRHVSQVHKQTYKYNCTLCEYGTHDAKRLKIHIRSRHHLEPATIMAVEHEIDSTSIPSGYNPDEAREVDLDNENGLTATAENQDKDTADCVPDDTSRHTARSPASHDFHNPTVSTESQRAGTFHGFPGPVYQGVDAETGVRYGHPRPPLSMQSPRLPPSYGFDTRTMPQSISDPRMYGQRPMYGRGAGKTPLNSLTMPAQPTAPYPGYRSSNALQNMFP